jgi:EAL domain-containing protein (putative c-di-GMP-specific phosphodiesterase class I)
MVGVEALLRWNHATRGMIPPATFIPVAEQMGLMDTIGVFVLRRALQEAKRWPDDLYIAVNLSPLQVRDATIVNMVRSALAESAVAPSRLVLEITEGVLIDNPDGQAYQGPPWARCARRARRFWLRVFQPRLFAALSAR